ncbi:tetratricopeptide (TPR) repeat protein [Bacillus pakistanensis]|uniref:Tetratricopeptide (TPR) repeat protein n=1 Tax=Rossellomorea pakistanensis TaxID=992288 RepID=A0ABS2NAT2_9BACI|nr:tetratricopeptide repeat protein [Bacillus pakistanensis]MBM7584869.1 tetratricopeptide (TPR) repeat protein [Bacillus pakistanensis]
MKKKGKSNSKNDNIIYFPGLKDRLFEKGLHALENQLLDEAIVLLNQAYEIDPNNGEVATAYTLSLYENRNYEEAKDICKQMLHSGLGDYFEVVDLYLMILIQLNEHREVIETIHALFEEKEVPFEKEDHFRKLLSFSEKVLKGKTDESMKEEFIHKPSSEVPYLLKGKSLEEQTLILAQLVHQNIHPFLTELIDMLKDDHTHPFLKTMIFNVLREHGYDKDIKVSKFKMSYIGSPTPFKDVFETQFFNRVTAVIEDHLHSLNPTLGEQMIELLKRHCFLLYPFEIEKPYETVGLAYIQYGLSLYGEVLENGPMDAHQKKEISEVIENIKELEEISSPTI